MRLKKHEEDLRRTNDATLLRDKTVSPSPGAGLHQDEDMRELVALLKMARRSEEFVWWETGKALIIGDWIVEIERASET